MPRPKIEPSDPIRCCIIGLCCPPISDRQEALAEELGGAGLAEADAAKAAAHVFQHYRLALL